MITNAANKNFTIRAMDVTKAFLQGKPLERKARPIPWRSKKTSRVADSTKSAGRKILEQILVHMFTDIWPLYDSIYLTKQDAVSRGKAEKSIWVDTKNIIVDVLTKESALIFLITEILDNGWVDTKNMIADVLTKDHWNT